MPESSQQSRQSGAKQFQMEMEDYSPAPTTAATSSPSGPCRLPAPPNRAVMRSDATQQSHDPLSRPYSAHGPMSVNNSTTTSQSDITAPQQVWHVDTPLTDNSVYLANPSSMDRNPGGEGNSPPNENATRRTENDPHETAEDACYSFWNDCFDKSEYRRPLLRNRDFLGDSPDDCPSDTVRGIANPPNFLFSSFLDNPRHTLTLDETIFNTIMADQSEQSKHPASIPMGDYPTTAPTASSASASTYSGFLRPPEMTYPGTSATRATSTADPQPVPDGAAPPPYSELPPTNHPMSANPDQISPAHPRFDSSGYQTTTQPNPNSIPETAAPANADPPEGVTEFTTCCFCVNKSCLLGGCLSGDDDKMSDAECMCELTACFCCVTPCACVSIAGGVRAAQGRENILGPDPGEKCCYC